MKAKLTVEFNDKFIELVKQETGYTNSEALAAYLKGIYDTMLGGDKEYVEKYTIEVE